MSIVTSGRVTGIVEMGRTTLAMATAWACAVYRWAVHSFRLAWPLMPAALLEDDMHIFQPLRPWQRERIE